MKILIIQKGVDVLKRGFPKKAKTYHCGNKKQDDRFTHGVVFLEEGPGVPTTSKG